MRKSTVSFKSSSQFMKRMGFSDAETELLMMKGTVIGQLEKEREKRSKNNTEFAGLLGIPKSRWSSILRHPDRVTLDYLLMLAAKCGALFKLTKRAA